MIMDSPIPKDPMVTALVNESMGRPQLIITPDSFQCRADCGEDLKKVFFTKGLCAYIPVGEVLPYE